jgi:hypothetical protein
MTSLFPQINKGGDRRRWKRVYGQDDCTNNKAHVLVIFSVHPIEGTSNATKGRVNRGSCLAVLGFSFVGGAPRGSGNDVKLFAGRRKRVVQEFEGCHSVHKEACCSLT